MINIKKLNRLSKTQVEILDKVKQRWIDLVLTSGKNLCLDDIKGDIYKIYKKIKLKKPNILIADSWLSQQYMIFVPPIYMVPDILENTKREKD